MAIIDEIIRMEEDGAISFGDYLAEEKKKRDNFEAEGSQYKIKTHNEITRLEKNGKLFLETVPGAAVHNMLFAEEKLTFGLEGAEDTRITVELEPDCLYRVVIEGESIGNVKSNISGKVIFSLDLDENIKRIEIIKA